MTDPRRRFLPGIFPGAPGICLFLLLLLVLVGGATRGSSPIY